MLPFLRIRTVALAALFSFTTFFVSTVPDEASPIERPEALAPAPVDAGYCANVASFEGKLNELDWVDRGIDRKHDRQRVRLHQQGHPGLELHRLLPV